MGIGYIQPKKFGSVTEPVPFPLALPSAESKTARDHGLLSSIALPGSRGTMIANGMDPLRHIYEDDVYRTGLLAPKSACVATPTGTRATAVLDIDASSDGASPYTIANGDWIVVGSAIQFVTALNSPPLSVEVAIGATPSITLDNLRHLFDSTGTKGVQYDYPSWWRDHNSIEVTAKTAWSVSFRIKRYGSNGDGWYTYLLTGSWTDCTLGSSGGSVGAGGNFENGADGTGDEPAAGTYNYRYSYFRKADGAVSGASPTVESQIDEGMRIDLSVVAAPLSDDDIDYKRWWRTDTGGSTLYRGADIAEADTTDADTLSNTTLKTHTTYDPTIHRLWEGGQIERVRFLAEYKGRWVGAGHILGADYVNGTCSVHGSDASDATATNVVTLATNGHVTKEMEHWTFQTEQSTEDDALEYAVIYVDETNDKLYLHQDWLGATATGKSFRIRDTRDPFRLYYSEPVLPNNTSSSMNIDGIQSTDPAGVTGLFPAFESLIAFTGTGLWRLTGSDPVSFRLTHEYEGVGCVAGHSIVLVDNILYWLGADGIYAWQGSGEPFKASSPPGEPRGIARTIARINTQHAHSTFAHYDPEKRIIRWFVALDSNITNRHAIVFDLQTKSWSLDTANDITYAKTVTDKDGNLRTLAGDIYGHVWELDVSNTDGAYGFEPVQTITSPTKTGISVTGTPLPASSALKGVPVWMMDGDGDFTRATVSTNTTSAVVFTTRLATTPSAGMPCVFGGIHQRIESGWFSYDEKNLRKIFEAIRVAFAYKAEGQYWVSVATNQGTVTVLDPDGGDLMTLDGEEHHWEREEGKRLKIRIDTIGPGFDPAFQALETWVRTRD